MRTFDLPDGRRISYRDCGDPAGSPILYCHGAPGSGRSIHEGMSDAAARLGVRLIAPNRPGYAGSDFRPATSLLDWPGDVDLLMDSIGIERYSVVGYSMGGIHALACARSLPTRAERITLVASLAPDMLGAHILPTLPPALAQTLHAARLQPDDLKQAIASLTSPQLFDALTEQAAQADKKLLAEPAVRDAFLADCVASLHGGGEGMWCDFKFAASDWNFAPEEVSQPVTLWHGTADANVPFTASAALDRRLPHGKLMPLADLGHLCLFSHWEPILADLIGP